MTDTPITNCYLVTRELALAYFSGDPRAAAFIATPATMDWYLKRATKAIDAMPLAGPTYYIYNRNTTIDTDEQSLAFPRVIDGKIHEWDDDTGLPIVPQNVKDACCEEALALYEFYADDDAQERYDRQEQGVSSASNPSGSESYQAGIIAKRRGLHSVAAYDIMKFYLAGSVDLVFGGIAYTPDILTSGR
jgi:hypothetical protein